MSSARGRYENDVGKVGADAIRVTGGQGLPSELSVCTNEEIRQRDQGRDRSGLLSTPFAVPAIQPVEESAGRQMICTAHDRTRPDANSGCWSPTFLGDALGIRTGILPDQPFADRRGCPCVKR